MKFVLETVSKCSGRLGILNGSDKLANVKLPTPTLVLHTKGGSVPHLSQEVFRYMTAEPQILQYSLTNTEHMEDAVRACGEGISGFVAQKQSVSLLILNDPAELCQPGFHEKDVVPVFSRSGRKNFTVEQYMNLVEAFKPEIYAPLFDGDTGKDSSKKREKKSVDRTEKFVEQCLNIHKKSETLKSSTLLGPVVGGYNIKLREQSIKFLQQFNGDFGGYIIAGLHLNGPSAVEAEGKSLYDLVSNVCALLPPDKARFAFGAFTPKVVLELVVRGVDVFDTSYPFLKTQQSRALSFCFNTESKDVENRETELDLRDSRWAQDFTGFVSSCSCLACTKHTKAYSHHLYSTREMLAPILLMIHNLHHYFKFFEAIRQHVTNGTVRVLIDHLGKQKEAPPFDENLVQKYSEDFNGEKKTVNTKETVLKRVKL